jgi:hypothetical protein
MVVGVLLCGGSLFVTLLGAAAFFLVQNLRNASSNAKHFAELAARHGGLATDDSVSLTFDREGRKVFVQYGLGRRGRIEGTFRVTFTTLPGPRFSILPRATTALEGPRGTAEAMAASLLGGPAVNDAGTAARRSGQPLDALRSTFASGNCESDGHTLTLHDEVAVIDEARLEAGVSLAVSRYT